MSKNRKDKIEKSALVNGAVICIAVAAISFTLIPGLAAQGTGDSVNVTVNAPEYVAGTFNVSIDVDKVTNFNAGQFDLSFNSSVVNVTDIADGSLDGETIPVYWAFMDGDTIRVLLDVPGITGLNGSGKLATISFTVVGETGDKSVLDISNGLLVNNEAEAIPAEWIDDEVTVGPAPCPAKNAVYQAAVPDPERILNPLRALRDDNLKAEYVDRYYDNSPMLTMVMRRADPALAYEAARLLVMYSPMVSDHVDGIDVDKLISRSDAEAIVSFTDRLKRGVQENRGGIGAEKSQELIKFLDEFYEQVNASEGKTFSEALRGTIYYKG